MLVYLLSGAFILPSALVLLACRYELINSYEFCFGVHLGPLIISTAFIAVGSIPAIAIVLYYRWQWLIVIPAVLLALNGLALWTGLFWLSMMIPSELQDPIFYAGETLYAIAALAAGIVWLVRLLQR